MAGAPNQPPEQVRAAAAVVQKWLDEQQKPGAGAPPVPELTAAERFDRHRQQQLERSRADEPNLRKARS